MNDYSSHKEYFTQSYTNGTDIWTHNNYTVQLLNFIKSLPHKGTVLELGSGRGHTAYILADLGMKVIGLDFVDEITKKNNEFVREHGYGGKVAFKTGDVLAIPFQEETFDTVVDIGTFHHIHPKDWSIYAEEVFKVLKPGGFLLLVELSRKTDKFLHFTPSDEVTGTIEYEKVLYHFFERKEFEEIFSFGFSIIKSEVHTFPSINNHSYIFTLFKKK